MRRDERGAGTLLVAIVAALVVALTALGVVASAVVVAGHRARQAADLAALSAAHAYAAGDDACRTAAVIAAHNGGSLASCTISGPRSGFAVAVAVSVPLPVRVAGTPSTLTVTSRAGTPARS